MTNEELLDEFVKSLNKLVTRVRQRVPGVDADSGKIKSHAYATFIATPDSETLDLCIYIHRDEDETRITADLVRGGTGDILDEQLIVTLVRQVDLRAIQAAITSVHSFVEREEERVIAALA